MKTAIIDDETKDRETLRAYLERFAAAFSQSISVQEFPDAESFLRADTNLYDLVILDVDMPGISGLEAARIIRKNSENVIIMFVTNMAQYAIAGYEVEAIDYIVKPVAYFDFEMKMQRVIKKMAKRLDSFITIDSGDSVRRIGVSGILYVEVQGHYIIYHTQNREFKARGSMKDCEALLAPYGFIRTQKSFMVNASYIDNITSSEVRIKDIAVPVGRFYRDGLMKEYLKNIDS